MPADCLRCNSFRLLEVEGLPEASKPLKVTGLQMSGTVMA
jgi:hypothetical protein